MYATLSAAHSPAETKAPQSDGGRQGLRGTEGVPRKGVWTSVNMRVWTCEASRVKHDHTSCYSRPPFLGTPLVYSRRGAGFGCAEGLISSRGVSTLSIILTAYLVPTGPLTFMHFFCQFLVIWCYLSYAEHLFVLGISWPSRMGASHGWRVYSGYASGLRQGRSSLFREPSKKALVKSQRNIHVIMLCRTNRDLWPQGPLEQHNDVALSVYIGDQSIYALMNDNPEITAFPFQDS